MELIVGNRFMGSLPGSFAVATCCLLAILVAPLAQAQTDTAFARSLYADINSRLGEMVRKDFVAQKPDAEFFSKVVVWQGAEGVRKLQVTDPDDDGEVGGEYYFDREQLVFYFGAIKGYTKTGRLAARIETRQYFRQGRMFKWLAGIGSNSGSTPQNSTEFVEEEQSRIAAASFYLKVAKEKTAAQLKR